MAAMGQGGGGSGSSMPSLTVERFEGVARAAHDGDHGAWQQISQIVRSVQSTKLLQQVLDSSTDSVTLGIASNALRRLFVAHQPRFQPKDRLQMRNYMMRFLAKKGPRLQHHAVQAAISVVATITKHSWFSEEEKIRQIIPDITVLLQSNAEHNVIGLQLLQVLVDEMNTRREGVSITEHRRTAVSFRDAALVFAFDLGLTILNHVALQKIQFGGVPPDHAAKLQHTITVLALSLVDTCLGFDFVGTTAHEASEEATTIHVPSTWRSRISNPATLKLFFALYRGLCTGKVPVDQTIAEAGSKGEQAPPSDQRIADAIRGGALSVSELMRGNCQSIPIGARQEPAVLALNVLTRLASVRRGLFADDKDRVNYLTGVLQGVAVILEAKMGIDGSDQCFLAFCRFAGRVKSNFQLSEMMQVPEYPKWIAQMQDFSIATFNRFRDADATIGYILGLWSRMADALPYVHKLPVGRKGMGEPIVDKVAPQIASEYVKSRLLLAQKIVDDDDDVMDPYCDGNDDRVRVEVEQLPRLFRQQYALVSKGIAAMWDIRQKRYDEIMQQYKAAQQSGAGPPPDGVAKAKYRLEYELAWLVYIISSVVGTQQFGGIGTKTDTIVGDAELCKRVLQLLDQTEAAQFHRPSRCHEFLESGLLFFIENFRKTFVSESKGMPSPKTTATGKRTWQPFSDDDPDSGAFSIDEGDGSMAAGSAGNSMLTLADASGGNALGLGSLPIAAQAAKAAASIGGSGARAHMTVKQKHFAEFFKILGHEHTVVVGKLVNKLCNNLRAWVDRRPLMERSLDVFFDMAFTYSSVKLLNTLPATEFILKNHGPRHYPFLDDPSQGRVRTKFYTCLARVLFMQEDPELKFDVFIRPVMEVLDQITPRVAAKENSEELSRRVAGVARDLRGIAAAAHNKRTYRLVYDAVFPSRITPLVQSCQVFADKPHVSNPVLKCLAELAFNRGIRISFPSSSPNGIVLFKSLANALVLYQGAALRLPRPPPQRVYPARYKGLMVAMRVLERALHGGYCPFGVFEYYKDACLKNALKTGLVMMRDIPPQDLPMHPKLKLAFYDLLSILFRNHMPTVAAVPPGVFQPLIKLIKSGLEDLDTGASTSAAQAADALATSYVKGVHKEAPETRLLTAHVKAMPQIFEYLMQHLFWIVAFSDVSNHYTLSRPLLSLMVAAARVKGSAFAEMREKILKAQKHQEKREKLRGEFKLLVEGITSSLDAPNRERFARRLTLFKLRAKSLVPL